MHTYLILVVISSLSNIIFNVKSFLNSCNLKPTTSLQKELRQKCFPGYFRQLIICGTPANPFHSSVTFRIETSNLIYYANQITGFCMNCTFPCKLFPANSRLKILCHVIKDQVAASMLEKV